MEEKEENDGDRATSSPGDSRDGSINFARYSLEQLTELQHTFDRRTLPRIFDNLLSELERRRSAGTQPSSPEQGSQPKSQENPHPSLHGEAPKAVSQEPREQQQSAPLIGRFTASGGLRGWLQAKSKRLAVYGEGFIEVRPQKVVVGGWRRNWLGVAHRSELFISREDISDVIQGDGIQGAAGPEGEWIRFRYETSFGRHRPIEFQARSVHEASTLAASLPAVRSAEYELEWSRAVVDATKRGDHDRASDAVQFEKETNLAVARIERVALLATLDHRPRALANSHRVVVATNWFTARRWKCIEPPPAFRKPAAPALPDAPLDRPLASHRGLHRPLDIAPLAIL